MTCTGYDRSKDAAVKTLERLGYTYHGGEEWKPPLGKQEFFDEWIEYKYKDRPVYQCPICHVNSYITHIKGVEKCGACGSIKI